ncbi:MAG: phytoene desaturase family protein [Syntrophales bacterium]
MESERPYDALIIGAGIGGLSAGIILSRIGLRVAVIEKNPLPGGMMRGYRRAGMDCPVGVHYFGSFGEGEPLRRICDFLGVTEQMAVERMGQGSPIDRYVFDDFTFDLPEGIDAFAASLRQAFPDDRQPIAQIIDDLRATLDVQNSFAFFSPAPSLLDSKLYAPLGEYLAGMHCSAGLRGVLGVAARWMGMSESDCPVFYHHFALASYLLSSWRLRGTGAELAEAFVARFKELGGTLICGDAVTAILPPGAAVGGVRLASGRALDGSRLVAAIHPKRVIGMLPEGAVKPRHARLIGELAETEGLFALSAAVDASTHPALPYNLFRLRADREGTVKDGAFYQLRDGREGKNLLVIITKSPYAEWSRWADTQSGSRGEAYAEAKAGRAGRLLREAEGIFGPLAGATVLDAYTPLSLRDWVGSPEGSPYGIMRSIRQLPAAAALSRLAPAGLYFAGQNALSPGVLGTLLGSLQVARQVLGPERFASEVFERLMQDQGKRGPL